MSLNSNVEIYPNIDPHFLLSTPVQTAGLDRNGIVLVDVIRSHEKKAPVLIKAHSNMDRRTSVIAEVEINKSQADVQLMLYEQPRENKRAEKTLDTTFHSPSPKNRSYGFDYARQGEKLERFEWVLSNCEEVSLLL